MTPQRTFVFLLLASLIAPFLVEAQTFSTTTLRPVGYHPARIAYFDTPYLANSLHHSGEWFSFSLDTGNFGTAISYNTAQFENGYPRFLNPNQGLRAPLFGLNINNQFRPAAWPRRDSLVKGQLVLTWKGNADIRIASATFVAAGSSGGATGSLTDGRRIYLVGAQQSGQTLEVRAVGTPLTDIKVWLPVPDDPATTARENETASLENQLFHPLFLRRIADADWGFIRFMDWGATNASPQQDWTDRRLPGHVFMTGIINSRQPSAAAQGDRETGAAWEHMVALCNLTGRNLWINVPHLATDDYMTRLARLIRFGSDGVNPYDVPNANPVHPPLRADLKVFVEFSNEIWSNGFSFAQGNWADEEAARLAIPTRAQFTARRFCDTWRIFQQVFGGADRLVRVAALFTAGNAYSRTFLQEMGAYGSTRSPAVRPDVLALTTYFGNGIQDFVNQQGFTTGKLFDDPYWTSILFNTHMETAFDEWKRRILSGDAIQGSGPDSTGIGGGFSTFLRTLPNDSLGYSLPIIAYEGGPSLFTDTIDANLTNGAGVPTDDGVTTFIEAMNRDPRIADVYRIHLDIAKSKALWTHTPYLDTSTWSRFGQWGHLETLDQIPANAPKYSLMLEHFSTFSTLRHVDTPLSLVPQFTTAANLPAGIAGQAYTIDIVTSGGNGALTTTVVGASLEQGLSISTPAAGTFRISGTPTGSRKSFIFARVNDADGDPAWRIFTLETFGGAGTLVQSDFRGASPALSRPFSTTFVRSSKVTWSGWDIGSVAAGERGVTPQQGADAFVFSVVAPSAGNETLAQAITDDEYLKATVTPAPGPLDLRGGEIRFSTRRITFHAPLGYALFSSIGGFAQANALYVSSEVTKDNFDEIQHVVTLPSTTAFSAVTSPIELRIYAFGAQFAGHTTSLSAFKLTEKSTATATTTTVTSSTNPSNLGQAVTFTVSVTGTAGTPAGSVVFRDGVTELGSVALSAGSASLTTSTLGGGARAITATYTGSTNFSSSISTTLTQTVNKAIPTIALTSSINPSQPPQPVTFTATLSPLSATGIVTFLDGTTTLGTGIVSNGVATLTTSGLSNGAHSIMVSYGGDAGFQAIRSAPLTQRVGSQLPNGDANGDGTVSVADVFFLINRLFTGGAAPIGSGDVNNDGTVSVADVFYLITFLFAGGPAPL